MKRIAILGSTGSIGTQALSIIKENPISYQVTALSCGKNLGVLEDQIATFNPSLICVKQEEDALILSKKYPKVTVFWGDDGLVQLAQNAPCDLLLNGLVGMCGLSPTLAAIAAGRQIALANKETLVAGGRLVMEATRTSGTDLLPVDSEHSAIFQALQGNRHRDISRLLLTASGGPFRGYSKEQLKDVSLAEALAHPNWTMGPKITIDSATMMNKGLEVIEAHWLFDVPPEKIEVLVHKESIVHSLVEFIDHSVIGQLGTPDMRGPIRYAFSYPGRSFAGGAPLDLLKIGALHFEPVSGDAFPCLSLAYEVLKSGGSYPVVLNAANEELVRQFLEGEIAFTDIFDGIRRALDRHDPQYDLTLEDVLAVDLETRRVVS